MKFTIYIGIHDGKAGERPKTQKEFIHEINMEVGKAFKLHKALEEIYKYLMTGLR